MKTLKTTFKPFFLLMLIGFAFMSCNKDDDDTPQEITTQERLIGKWLFETTAEDFPRNPCEKTSFLQFLNATSANSVLYTENTDQECVALLSGSLSYEFISESTIKFTNNDADVNTFTSEVISVSDTKLVLKNFAFIEGNIEFKRVP